MPAMGLPLGPRVELSKICGPSGKMSRGGAEGCCALMTTVSQPLPELAKLAVETMLDLCDGKKTDLEVVNLCLPTRLIERDSVATLQP